jgi:hypothetical protein
MEIYDFMRRQFLRVFLRAGVIPLQQFGGAMKRHPKKES